MTVELNLGLGFLSNDNENTDTRTGLAGLNFGIGGWLNPNMAVTGRISVVTIGADEDELGGLDGRLSHLFLGPSLQYWANNNFWVGGGIGLSILYLSIEDIELEDPWTEGFGLDLRGGYTFNTGGDSTFNVSVELTPGFYSPEGGDEITITGVSFLFGYQHL